MNTKTRIKNLYNLAPEYPRIPHLDKKISNMTHDDIQLEGGIQFPITGWVQEKLDGANMGVSWTSGPVIRNRNNILKKGYIKKETPAKLQFRSSWNWLHAHNKDIQKIKEIWQGDITIYGEFLYAKHSIFYDKLPDIFIAYDIYSVEDRKFIGVDDFESLMSQTNIEYVKSEKVNIKNIDELIRKSEMKSNYITDGLCEGIVFKSGNIFRDDCFKIVNKYFKRRDDFNDSEIIRNIMK